MVVLPPSVGVTIGSANGRVSGILKHLINAGIHSTTSQPPHSYKLVYSPDLLGTHSPLAGHVLGINHNCLAGFPKVRSLVYQILVPTFSCHPIEGKVDDCEKQKVLFLHCCFLVLFHS